MENRIQRFLKNGLVRVVIGGATIGAGIEGIHFINPDIPDVPALYSRATSFIEKARLEGQSFSNETGEIISPKNTSSVTIDEATAILENMKRENLANDTTLLFPLQLPNGKTIRYEFREKGRFDPKDGKYIFNKDRNILWMYDIPEETNIIAPIDGGIVVSSYNNGSTQGMGIYFESEGIGYKFGIGNLYGDFTLKPADSFPTIPEFVKTGQRVKVKRGQILATTTKAATMSIEYTSSPTELNQEDPVAIRFLTTKDNAGIEKLVVLKRE